MVRLVIDRQQGEPSKIEVVSLLRAMEISTELEVDLIGVQLHQDPPVVRAQDYNKMAYRSSKSKAENSSKNKSNTMKEMKFRVSRCSVQ
jgi:translation initiation factor IF-3